MQESQQPRAFSPGAVTDSDKLFPAPGKEYPEKRRLGWAERGRNYGSFWGLGPCLVGWVTGRWRVLALGHSEFTPNVPAW